MRVIKVGGNQLEEPEFRERLASIIAGLPGPMILVHGGGQAVDEIQVLLGSEPEKVQGLRRTGPEALRAALMVLCGQLRAQLVAALMRSGIRAIGLSGFDAGMIRVRKLEHPTVDLGFVGEILKVDTELLRWLLDAGLLPVLSPLSLGLDGQIYNVNSDNVAGAIAEAMGANELAFVSDVSGVHRSGRLVPQLEISQTEILIAKDEIRAGMVPKVRAGSDALRGGVAQVRIVDLPGLASDGGTVLTAEGP
ncbi:MAG: acetylglutamate kinase [Chloroflexi bacterium]|nr:acetylglutamate kinase [Chloroflexota bacterium]